jgi:hypothetical protein
MVMGRRPPVEGVAQAGASPEGERRSMFSIGLCFSPAYLLAFGTSCKPGLFFFFFKG